MAEGNAFPTYAELGGGRRIGGPPRPRGGSFGRVRLRIKFDATKEFHRFTERLGKIAAAPEVLLPMLRQAAAETILENVRTRFVHNLPNALEMESQYIPHADTQKDLDTYGRRRSRNVDELTGVFSGGAKARDRNTAEMATTLRLYQRLSAAQKRGNAKTLAKIYAAITRHQTRFVRSLNRSRTTKRQISRHRLSSGRFRPLALKVLQLMTDAGLVEASRTAENGGTLSISVGNMPRLNYVATPSATQFALSTKRRTSSPYDILWRQLEFGTGLYSKDPFGANHPATKYTALGGGWWYDPNPPGGLYLRGTRGVHALRDAKTGEPYREDFAAFEAAADVVISEWLVGRRR